MSSIGHSFDPIFEQGLPKVDKETEPIASHFEVGKKLFAVHRCQLLDGLQLNDKALVDDEVGTESQIKGDVIVVDGHSTSRSTL